MLDLSQCTVEYLLKALAKGEITSVELVKECLDTITRHNHSGKMINAVLELNPEVLLQAEASDRERANGKLRGPLHGIPILLKDNIDTGDGMHTSAGSLALQHHYAAQDSEVARRLRAAGAILLGKANMTEWANFMSSHMKNGFSSRGGQVLNPYGPGVLDVGGSSSGPGAAVACGMIPAAIGSETSGSILSPANANSVVGVKPTLGLISRCGIIPIMFSQDTAGPLTQCVWDAAILLNVLAGKDEKDPATLASPECITEYTAMLKKDALKGIRLGIVNQSYSNLEEERVAAMKRVIQELREAGAEIVEIEEIPGYTAIQQTRSTAMLHEFKPALNAYLKTVEPYLQIHSLSDVIAYNTAHTDQCLVHGQDLLEKADALSGSLTEPLYWQDRKQDYANSREKGIDWALQQYSVHALIFRGNAAAGIGAKAGYPSVIVPAGYLASGQPFGISFTASAWSEARLLAYAYAYEQATLHRQAPQMQIE
ncbi:MAG TPA: amidase family protein [Bacillota bacterium]|nr:amidase family protein [Bacillota bacterium]